MVEFYYWREGSGGNKSRLECVVFFLPDVWSAQASRIEWSNVQEQYNAACESALRKLEKPAEPESSGALELSQPAPADAESPAAEKSQIVCSQFCLVMFPAARANLKIF
jgi:hypothetical protein